VTEDETRRLSHQSLRHTRNCNVQKITSKLVESSRQSSYTYTEAVTPNSGESGRQEPSHENQTTPKNTIISIHNKLIHRTAIARSSLLTTAGRPAGRRRRRMYRFNSLQCNAHTHTHARGPAAG